MKIFNKSNGLRTVKDKTKAQVTVTPSFGRLIINKKAEEVLFGGVDFKGILIYVNKSKVYLKPTSLDDAIPFRQLTRTKSFCVSNEVIQEMGFDPSGKKSRQLDLSTLPEEVEGISGLYELKKQ